jgi:hypothetical protein
MVMLLLGTRGDLEDNLSSESRTPTKKLKKSDSVRSINRAIILSSKCIVLFLLVC